MSLAQGVYLVDQGYMELVQGVHENGWVQVTGSIDFTWARSSGDI